MKILYWKGKKKEHTIENTCLTLGNSVLFFQEFEGKLSVNQDVNFVIKLKTKMLAINN